MICVTREERPACCPLCQLLLLAEVKGPSQLMLPPPKPEVKSAKTDVETRSEQNFRSQSWAQAWQVAGQAVFFFTFFIVFILAKWGAGQLVQETVHKQKRGACSGAERHLVSRV